MTHGTPVLFPECLRDFAARFNEGRYWESHELLEVAWRKNHSDFFKGLILYASAYVHVQRGNAHGVSAQFRKAERYLTTYMPSYLGVDVNALLANGVVCRQLAEAHAHTGKTKSSAESQNTRWAAELPRIELRLQAELLRGDEPELGDA